MSFELTIDVLSLFPAMIDGFLRESMLGRAQRKGIIQIRQYNLRQWTAEPHFQADDRPFGGGAGMILKPEPIGKAITSLRTENSKTIYLCPDGELLRTEMAQQLAQESHLILLCGHYEGIDERIREKGIDREISIGDYVLTNGVLPAAVLIDAICRHIPGVLGKPQSLKQDSFSDGLLTFPQYTRPEVFDGETVPAILLSGNHKKIDEWRRQKQIERTTLRRPDLLEKLKHHEREN